MARQLNSTNITEKVSDVAPPAGGVENTSKADVSEKEASNEEYLSNVENIEGKFL